MRIRQSKQDKKTERVKGSVVGFQTEMRPSDPQERTVSATIATPSTTDTATKPPMFHCFRFLGRLDVVGGKGDNREVRHKDQQQHRKGGDNELTRRHEGDGHESGLQDCPADLVDDVCQMRW